jgi:PAS domain-containing protein
MLKPVFKSLTAKFMTHDKDKTKGRLPKEPQTSRTLELLKTSEEKYRSLVDNALVGIYKSNLKGEILYVNEALVKMLEFKSPEEFISVEFPRFSRHI